MNIKQFNKLLFITLLLVFSCSKLPEEDLRVFLNNHLEETKDFIILSASKDATETFIFYPGGLVDPMSYLKWQDQLVSLRPNLRIVTVRMPSNLAVLNAQKGARLFEVYSDTEKWLVGGHSLGGAMATSLVEKNQNTVDGLVYLAAYPADDRLKNTDTPILSIYAEFDGLATVSDIKEREDLLPIPYHMTDSLDFPQTLSGRTLYYKIKGGNHAQFGNYGEQKDDLAATISTFEQQSLTLFLINELLARL